MEMTVGPNVGMALEAALEGAGQVAQPEVQQPSAVIPPEAKPEEVRMDTHQPETPEQPATVVTATASVAVTVEVKQPERRVDTREGTRAAQRMVDELTGLSVVPPQAKIVAIEFPLGERSDGKVTVQANKRYRGRVVIGPARSMSGLVPAEHFAASLREIEVVFDGFWFDPHTGNLRQGSMVNYTPSCRKCPDCGRAYQINLNMQKKLHDITGSDVVTCNHPDCVSARAARNLKAAELRWTRAPQPQIHPDDPIVGKMYTAFCTNRPVLDELGMIPRVWGVYPLDKAPTDWVPAKQDWKAQVINARCMEKGWTIRPYQITKQVQRDVVRRRAVNVMSAPILERTFTRDGTLGAVVGFMRPHVISPDKEVEKEMFGYKLRFLAPRWKTGRPEHHVHEDANEENIV